MPITGGGAGGGHEYVDRGDPSAHDWDQDDFTFDQTWRELDLSSIVPAGAVLVHLTNFIQATNAQDEFMLRKNGNSNTVNICRVFAQVSNVFFQSETFVACDTDRKVEYNGKPGVYYLRLSVRGWFVPA